MLLLSSRSGALAARVGPRVPLTVGPLLCGPATLLLRGIDARHRLPHAGCCPGCWSSRLGLVLLVAPLTSSVLAAAPDRFAGIASGINNAWPAPARCWRCRRCPPWSGSAGTDYQRPEVFAPGYARALLICAVLLLAGAALSLVGLPRHAPPPTHPDASPGRLDRLKTGGCTVRYSQLDPRRSRPDPWLEPSMSPADAGRPAGVHHTSATPPRWRHASRVAPEDRRHPAAAGTSPGTRLGRGPAPARTRARRRPYSPAPGATRPSRAGPPTSLASWPE